MSVEIVFNAFLIIGNLAGIMYLYYRIEKKIDKKVDKYISRAMNSKEGQMATEILEALQGLVKSKEGGELLKEATSAMKEFRGILQRLSLQPPQETDDDNDEPCLPSLRDAHG